MNENTFLLQGQASRRKAKSDDMRHFNIGEDYSATLQILQYQTMAISKKKKIHDCRY